jgi:hypothetical protein
MATICRSMSGSNLERINKIHYFLERLLVILQRYYKMLGPTIETEEIIYT